MRSRLLRTLILAHACWWFAWFAPAHQRGAMLALGSGAEKAGCCSPKSCCEAEGEKGKKPFKGTPTRQCAVCFLVAKLDVPTPLDSKLAPLGFLRWMEMCAPSDPSGVECQTTYLGRAPPLSPCV